MEAMNASISNFAAALPGNPEPGTAEVEGFSSRVDEICQKVDKLEERVNEIEQFYNNSSKKQASNSKGSSVVKDKEKERHVPSIRKQQQEASRREKAAEKRMEELMRQFGTILRNITQHKWAWPFMQPVDVKGLGLDDYYEVIDKPMDFSTIKKQMEAKEYKNVREICTDVRLVFKNAMKYNDERSDVHVMAKTLLAKFEEKWLQLLPKVTEEEKRREEEEAEAQLDMQLAQEAAHAKMARDASNELYEVDMHLEELREIIVQKCRKTSTEEKRKLGVALTRLSPEDLSKALEIVAQSNSGFQATAEEVDLDIDAQSECTLWRLKFFVKDALENQGKSAANTGGDNNNNNDNNNKNNNNSSINNNNNNKRKREICDALAKTAKKKNKKPSA
ncbi:Transcription factor like [Melia azedarach]|uniref:Transcription factor like n=1 Tax=Melia azedarach TaxID=155640 RepID=A0ACC1YAQ1_MELAZ|nr:Transcription factor like [Melia azedarach]